MNRPTKKYLLLFAVFVASLGVYIAAFPQLYMNEAYALWKGKLRLIASGESAKVLVLGDSRAMFGIDPVRLDSKGKSLAMAGTSPIESFILLRDYLERHPAPELVVYSVSPIRFSRAEYFWSNSVKMGQLAFADLRKIMDRAELLGDRSFTGIEISCFLCTKLELLAIHFRVPFWYQGHVAYGSLFFRGRTNAAIEEEVAARSGFLPATEHPERRGLSGREANRDLFSPSALLTEYFDETLELAKQKGTRVAYVFLPTNPASAASISSDYKAGFRAFLAEREKRFDNFQVLGQFHTGAPSSFADQDHLNELGARDFSDSLAAVFSEIN